MEGYDLPRGQGSTAEHGAACQELHRKNEAAETAPPSDPSLTRNFYGLITLSPRAEAMLALVKGCVRNANRVEPAASVPSLAAASQQVAWVPNGKERWAKAQQHLSAFLTPRRPDIPCPSETGYTIDLGVPGLQIDMMTAAHKARMYGQKANLIEPAASSVPSLAAAQAAESGPNAAVAPTSDTSPNTSRIPNQKGTDEEYRCQRRAAMAKKKEQQRVNTQKKQQQQQKKKKKKEQKQQCET